MRVLHVMRTYGVHGGERQLSQLFGENTVHSKNEEWFAFVHCDPECATLFQEKAPELRQIILWPKQEANKSEWYEFFSLLPRLFCLQYVLWRHVRKLNVKVCVAHGFQAALVAWPVVVLNRQLNSAYMHRTTKKLNRLRLAFILLYAPFDVVLGNSCAVMESLKPYVSKNRLMTLRNGIDLDAFDHERRGPLSCPLPAITGPIIIMVGRLIKSKGHEIVIDAVLKLLSSNVHLTLLIVGDGEERISLQCKTHNSGFRNSIIFLGQRSDVPRLLGCADIFVCASENEGMSNAVLEAMAAALPSVLIDAPGVTECHKADRTALIVKRDKALLGQGIKSLLQNPLMRLQMGKAARKRVVDKYSINANRQKYNELYSLITKV